jgi:hypothetical protein
MQTCPLLAVDRRLEDVHRQWHQAERSYFEPENFRLAIQSAIQTLRTVTFVLQNNKRLIPTFDQWYEEWRLRLHDDPMMRWMVEARNRIEKQGDLAALSFVKAEIVASYLKGPSIEVPAELRDDPMQLVLKIRNDPAILAHVVNHGSLRIQRRWIENRFPTTNCWTGSRLPLGGFRSSFETHTSKLG